MKFSFGALGTFAKKRLSGLYSIFFDALIDNSDNMALGRQGYMYSSYFTSIISSLIGGIYFTALMVKMEAGDVFIGYINTIMSTCVLIQILSPIILERISKRKTLLLTLRVIYNFLNIIFITIIPFLPVSKNLQLGIFMVTVILIYTINSFSAPGFSIWQMQSLPHERRANFFTVSTLGGQLINVPLGFFAGLLVDGFEASEASYLGLTPSFSAFFILRAFAVVAAVLEFKFLLQIKEYPYETDTSAKNQRTLSLLVLPLKNRAYMLTISIPFIRNLIGGLICSYYTVYVIDIVKMSYTYLSLASMVALPLTLIMTPIWAKLINKFTWFKMLAVANVGYSFAIICNAFVISTTQYMYIVVMIFCYLFNPAISINTSNIPYLKMPKTNQTAYLTFYSLFTACGTIIGNFLGTQIFGLTQGITMNILGFEMLNYQYINVFQGILMIMVSGYILVVRHILRKDPENLSLNL